MISHSANYSRGRRTEVKHRRAPWRETYAMLPLTFSNPLEIGRCLLRIRTWKPFSEQLDLVVFAMFFWCFQSARGFHQLRLCVIPLLRIMGGPIGASVDQDASNDGLLPRLFFDCDFSNSRLPCWPFFLNCVLFFSSVSKILYLRCQPCAILIWQNNSDFFIQISVYGRNFTNGLWWQNQALNSTIL